MRVRAPDADQVIFRAQPVFGLGVDHREVPFVGLVIRDTPLPVALIAGLPYRQAECRAHVIAAHVPVVPTVGMNQKAVGR